MNKLLKIIIISFVLALTLSPTILQAATFEFDGDGRVIGAIGGEITTADPEEITTNTMSWMLGLLGLVAVVVIIFAGFLWMTSAGNEEKISQAKKILTYSVIGLAVIVMSWSMVTYVFNQTADNFVPDDAPIVCPIVRDVAGYETTCPPGRHFDPPSCNECVPD